MSRILEKAYVVAALLYFSGAFADREMTADPTGGDFALFAVQCVVYAIAFIFMMQHRRAMAQGARHAKWVIALSAFACVSTLWSGLPLFTLRRSIVMLATSMFGVYFGVAFRRETQLRLLCWAFAIMALLSVLAAGVVPEYGIDHEFHQGDWCGIFAQKNMLGRLMVFGCASFLLLPGSALKTKVARAAGVILCAAVLVMSGSKTALLMSLLLLLLIAFYKVLATRRPVVVVVCALLVMTVTFAVWQSTTEIMLWLGRDPTLTGRIPLWIAATNAISHQPILGYGFGAFWQGLNGPSYSVINEVKWMAPHAHDGYLDLTLDLGYSGLVVFIVGIVLRFRSAFAEAVAARRETLWPLVYLSLILLYNVDESGLLRVNSLFCVVYASVFAGVVRPRRSRLAELSAGDSYDTVGIGRFRAVARTVPAARLV